MKKLIALALIITALLVITPPTYAETPSIVIKNHQITGDATPGGDFQIELNLLNSGENGAINVIVQPKVSYPFSVLGIGEKSIDKLPNNGEETLNFSLQIEETAIEGSYPVEFLINYEDDSGNQYPKTYVAHIAVKGRKELLAALSESSKTDVYSDDTSTLTFTVMNNGTASVKSLVAQASAEGALNVSWNSREHLIGSINPQGSTNFQLTIETSKRAQTGDYPLKIQLKGHNYSLEKTFQIPVKALPNLKLEYSETERLYPDKADGLLTIHIENEGEKRGREIEGRLLPKYPFSTEETTQYIEEIEVNHSKRMNFWLDIDEDAKPGNYSVNLSLEYKAWEKDFSQTLKIPLNIQEEEALRIKLWWLVPIAIAIIAVAFALKRLT